jgi:malonyl CoA-acyl carrier protein transacylase
MDTSSRAIAIVGVGAILPDAPNAPAYWQNLIKGRYSISEVTPDRWNPADYYDPDPAAPDKTYSKIGGWVRGFEFDWKRFKIPPKVAAAMDQGQQWAVTIAAEALADYGYPERPLDTERTAVILGTAMGGELHYITNQRVVFPEFAHALEQVNEFGQLPADLRRLILSRWREVIVNTLPPITEDSMPGELPNIVSGRVANVLNLRGPNFITDAACASSFAAIEAAVELLVQHKVDAVLSGGVDRNMGISSFVKFCKIGALSATGTRPFGEGADGFVMGEGCAAFLLKRLEDAERNGDKIYAVIRGVGGSSDGRGKGITAPNPIGQQLATRRAWENAGLDPATATLVEAHGTSTRVGDVVEVESLTAVFKGAPRGSIGLGSAKSNIGHLKAAAGAAGLLKAVLAIHHKILPPTLNARTPNPNINFAETPFYLLNDAREWQKPNGAPRRAGVSAYGFGGTNFHIVLEEHVPGMLTQKKVFAGAETREKRLEIGDSISDLQSPPPAFRGILALGAASAKELKEKLDDARQRAEAGWTPPLALPSQADLRAQERVVIDFGTHEELVAQLQKAQKAAGFDSPQAWKPLQAQGIFRGSGPKAGKIAFLFPGQGSQYLNMGRELMKLSPVVAEVFREADAVMTPILHGRPLTDYIFLDSQDPAAVKKAELELMQTAITQPAMLTLDIALYKLLLQYGFKPDMVMGHSLGEYAALVAAGILPFAQALEAAAARGSEMSKVSVDDNGWMAAVMAPYDVIEQTLKEIDGYVVAANINSYSQSVIGGESKAVEKAIALFTQKGFQAIRLPVSHAFHTRIVAPASKPLRQQLNRFDIRPPRIPLVANVTGELYPTTVEEIKDILELQIASPVQWVKGLETLYREGVRTFIEVGPKKALKGLVDDVLGKNPDVVSLFTNHPKTGEIPSFNQALCGLYAAGWGVREEAPSEIRPQTIDSRPQTIESQPQPADGRSQPSAVSAPAQETAMPALTPQSVEALGQMFAQALQQAVGQISNLQSPTSKVYDRNETPLGSVVISGTGLGLPGAEKPVMDPDNAMRILRGEQFVDLIPERFRKRMLAKRITRLVKGEDGSGRFETLTDPNEVIKLAGRPGPFDLEAEYGVPGKLIEALDITTQLAMAAGLDALREAGLPLVQTWRRTTTGKFLPDRWLLPEALRDETGVIFASAFPGGDRFVDEFSRYFTYQNRVEQLAALEDLRRYTTDPATLNELNRRIGDLRETLEREPYEFDRRFIFRILAMGHSQFAEYIGARGPNTHVNAACASTTQAIAIAEDWIRTGRCRRVIVIAADNVTSDRLMEWIGAGFLSTGAAATDDRVEEAALPFDRRRHGTLLGMGACALVIESEDAVRERGMRGIVELLASETNNSAYHGTRLDVEHISQVVDNLITSAERRFGLHRHAIAPQTVFMSHETFTPARGGSASAEIAALRRTFGQSANEIVMANTKGFTGHPMGVGIEDVIAVKILEYGIVPPVPNFKEIDPELGPLNLSRGGRYPVQYALHLSAGFGSQISLTFTRRIPGALDRVDNKPQYTRWLADVSGYDEAETEVVKRVLRVKSAGPPVRPPAPSRWQMGTGPTLRAAAPGSADGAVADRPARIVYAPTNGQAAQPTADRRPQTADAPQGAAVSDQPSAVRTPVAQPTADSRPQTAAAPAVSSPPSAVSADSIAEQVLALVAAKTGYPRDMLDMELDLEADLGIDTVKQAETFAAVREAFDIPRRDDLKLRDYPTLKHVIQFVKDSRPDLAAATATADGRPPTAAAPAVSGPPSAVSTPAVSGQPSAVSTPAVSSPPSAVSTPAVSSPPSAVSTPVVSGQPSAVSTHAVSSPPSADSITEQVLSIVEAKTGYPRDMLDLDQDLEADLGIDTVKQAETFAAVREAFDIPRRDDLKLRDYPTLKHVIQFVKDSRPDLAAATATADGKPPTAAAPAVSGQPSAVSTPAVSSPPSADSIAEQVLSIVEAKTGYPRDMLDLDQDLEADLGIDTVKQAETFAAVREAFDIPRRDDLKLRDYPTLKHVIQFVKDSRPDLAAATATADGRPPTAAAPAVSGPPSAVRAPTVSAPTYTLADADKMPRRVVTPILRPALDFCKPTGVTLDEKSRVVVMHDKGGVGKALVNRLQKRGVTVLAIEEPPAADALEAQLKAWLAEGPIQGVYWLTALDVEPNIEEMDLATWRELNRVRVKNLYTTMRALYESVSGPGTFLVSAVRLGGLMGYDAEGAVAPLGGAVVGFTKAYKREKPETTVKAVDFEAGRKTAEPADLLIAETLTDPGCVEIGYRDGARYAITFVEQPASDGTPGLTLGKDTVFVVTGAAGGITSAITTDLAQASGGIFYLLDLVPAPDRHDPHIALFRQGRETLKAALIEEARAAGEKVTPAQMDKRLMSVERAEAALRAIEAVEAAGGTVHYFSGDLRDSAAVQTAINDLRQRYGRIDVLLHAGGLEISRALPDKDPAQFDLVFDVKADGFFNLLKAAAGLPIGATVVFSSVAGRFGNNGQTDYSAANDLLCKLSSSFRNWRPETRGIAIDWTAWGGIGMATRGSIPKIMEMAGIDMLPPESGVPTIRRELTQSAFKGEIVVGGRLGILTAEFDATGGLDTEKVAQALAAWQPPLLMVGKVKAAKLYGGLEVETTLDPNVQPFLYDHALDGTPLLPGVMGTETFAQLASLLAPGYFVTAVEDLRFDSPFKFYRMQPRTLYLSATLHPLADGDLIAHAALRSITQPAKPELPVQEKIHFTAHVRLSKNPPTPPSPFGRGAGGQDVKVDRDAIYKVYFHGPAYQVLERAYVAADSAYGVMATGLPPNTQPAEVASFMAPRLIELCFQTAGVWEIKTKGVMALPMSIRSVTAYRQPEEANGERLFALVRAVDGGASFDAQVVDESGNVYVQLNGYRTVQLPGSVTL